MIVSIAAVVVIVLGLVMLAGVPLPFLRGGGASADGTTPAAVYALGTVYGLAGVCAGPLLGAVLTVASVSGSALRGGLTLLFFAAGMAAPLLLLAMAWGRLPFVQRLVRPREVRIGRWRNTWTSIVGGALTVALGAFLLVTSGTSDLPSLLGASDQIAVEDWAFRATLAVPDAVVLVITLAVAAAVWLVMRARRR